MVAGPERPGWPQLRYALSAMPQQSTPSDCIRALARRRSSSPRASSQPGFVGASCPRAVIHRPVANRSGQAALVLAIDSNYSGGASVMELLNDARTTSPIRCSSWSLGLAPPRRGLRRTAPGQRMVRCCCLIVRANAWRCCTHRDMKASCARPCRKHWGVDPGPPGAGLAQHRDGGDFLQQGSFRAQPQ